MAAPIKNQPNSVDTKPLPVVKENLTTETEPAKLAPQKIQVRVMQTPTEPDHPNKEYWIEKKDGTGQPFPVNARTYNKTFKNNPKFQLSQNQPEIKKK